MSEHRIVRLAALTGLVGALLSPSVAAAEPPEENVEVCHVDARGRVRPHTVAPSALIAHIRHGDFLPTDGECVRVVTFGGAERSPDDVAAISASLDAFSATSGVLTRYVPVEDTQSLIETATATRARPTTIDPATGDTVVVDVVSLPVARDVATLVSSRVAVPAAPATVATAQAGWSDDWLRDGTVDGTLYAVPIDSVLKSLVWFKPSTFVDPGGAPYPTPSTWDDLVALTDTIIADGGTPWCVGIESGEATGWNVTDWVEIRLLGSQPVSVYDGWIANDVAFTDPSIRDAWNDVVQLWHTPGAVFEGLATPSTPGVGIAETSFFDSALSFADDQCLMHRQGTFLPEFFDGDPVVASLHAFPFPADSEAASPAMGAGIYAVALSDDVDVALVHQFLASAAFTDARHTVQPTHLSAVAGQDLSLVPQPQRSFIEQLQTATVYRTDASDVMPTEVGSNVFAGFWGEGTRAVIGDGNAASYDYSPDGPVFSFDGTTVDQATQTVAELFCTVVPTGAAC